MNKVKNVECVWCESKYECSEHQKVTKKPTKEKIEEIDINKLGGKAKSSEGLIGNAITELTKKLNQVIKVVNKIQK